MPTSTCPRNTFITFFTDGRGTSAIPLQTQAAVLFLKLQNVSNAAVHQLMKVNHKFTEDMAASRQEYVLAKQKEIRLGRPQDMG